MLALALTALAASASAAALWVLLRRRTRTTLARASRIAPAGVKHLVRTLMDLSDVGIPLRADRSSMEKARLGSLLGLR
jgi:hypothetical protein